MPRTFLCRLSASFKHYRRTKYACDRAYLLYLLLRKDKFWGAVEDEDGNLHGQNQLGQLLMELRELVKTQSRQELTVVEPLAIENFLLLGKPIPVLRGVTRI